MVLTGFQLNQDSSVGKGMQIIFGPNTASSQYDDSENIFAFVYMHSSHA